MLECRMSIRLATRSAIILACACACTAFPPLASAQAPPSNAGTKIAFDQCYANLDLWMLTCEIHVLADGIETAVSGGVYPKWSPDGTRIAYVSGNYDTSGDIYVIDVNGSTGATNVSNADSAWNRGPAWSPDGTKIAFVSNRSGSSELYLASTDGTGLVRLTNGMGFTGNFAWSPDGRTIVLARDEGGPVDLYRMNADGSNQVRLTSNSGFGGDLAWSPDGSRLTFNCLGEVCAINPDGTGLVQLTTGSGFGGVFSPSGDRLAFATARFEGVDEI